MPKPFQKVTAASAPHPLNQKQHCPGTKSERSVANVTARSVEICAGFA
jgi:hypothetical protein